MPQSKESKERKAAYDREYRAQHKEANLLAVKKYRKKPENKERVQRWVRMYVKKTLARLMIRRDAHDLAKLAAQLDGKSVIQFCSDAIAQAAKATLFSHRIGAAALRDHSQTVAEQ